jgi:hypothetical protein
MENLGHNLSVLLFGEQLDRTAIWTAVIAGVTVLGVAVALRQLAGIRATSRADFTFRFIESFFTHETRVLFSLLMNSALTFDTKDIVENGKKIDRLPYLKNGPKHCDTDRRGCYARSRQDWILKLRGGRLAYWALRKPRLVCQKKTHRL